MGKIDRKEFLHQSVRLGGCCGAARFSPEPSRLSAKSLPNPNLYLLPVPTG